MTGRIRRLRVRLRLEPEMFGRLSGEVGPLAKTVSTRVQRPKTRRGCESLKCQRTTTPVLRSSRLLPLIAAIIVLAVFFVHDSRPAEAQQTTTVWSATLRAGTIMTNVFGCWNGSSFIHWRCARTASLTDDDFSRGGTSHSITRITLDEPADTLEVTLDKAFPQDVRTSGALHVDSSQFSLSSAAFSNGNRTAKWSNTGLDWSNGDRVQLSLTVPVGDDDLILLSASPTILPRGGEREVTVSLRSPAPRDLQVVITPSGTAGYELSAPHGETARFSFPEGATNPGNASEPGTFSISASDSAAVGETIVLTPASLTPGITGPPLTLTIEAGGL